MAGARTPDPPGLIPGWTHMAFYTAGIRAMTEPPVGDPVDQGIRRSLGQPAFTRSYPRRNDNSAGNTPDDGAFRAWFKTGLGRGWIERASANVIRISALRGTSTVFFNPRALIPCEIRFAPRAGRENASRLWCCGGCFCLYLPQSLRRH